MMNDDETLGVSVLRRLFQTSVEDEDDLASIDALIPSLFEARLKRLHEENPMMYPSPRGVLITGGAHEGFGIGMSHIPWYMGNATDIQRQNFDAVWESIVADVGDLRESRIEAKKLNERSELFEDIKTLGATLGRDALEELPFTEMLTSGKVLVSEGLQRSQSLLNNLRGSLANTKQNALIFVENFAERQASSNAINPRVQAAERFAGR